MRVRKESTREEKYCESASLRVCDTVCDQTVLLAVEKIHGKKNAGGVLHSAELPPKMRRNPTRVPHTAPAIKRAAGLEEGKQLGRWVVQQPRVDEYILF